MTSSTRRSQSRLYFASVEPGKQRSVYPSSTTRPRARSTQPTGPRTTGPAGPTAGASRTRRLGGGVMHQILLSLSLFLFGKCRVSVRELRELVLLLQRPVENPISYQPKSWARFRLHLDTSWSVNQIRKGFLPETKKQRKKKWAWKKDEYSQSQRKIIATVERKWKETSFFFSCGFRGRKISIHHAS